MIEMPWGRRGENMKDITDVVKKHGLWSQDIRRLHEATLEILCRQGVVFQMEDALRILADHGAVVDWSERRAFISEEMVADALSSAPKSFTLAARDPRYDYPLDGKNAGFTTFGVGFSVVDRKTGAIRDSSKTDLIETAILADALDTVGIYSHAVTARDCPLRSLELHEAETFLNHTVKHCMHLDLTTKQNIRRFIEMAALVVDGVDNLSRRPVVSALTCPQSPLYFHEECINTILELGRVGLPVNILPMAISGETAPVTLAGTILINNTEVLAGLVLSQCANPGAPVIYGCSSTSFDFFHSSAPVGSPTLALCSLSAAMLAKYYEIPCYVAGT